MCSLLRIKRVYIFFLFPFFSLNTFAQVSVEDPIGIEIGKDLVLRKCAQCHTDSIWRDQRQSDRAWEATLYRMMGRGAVWTKEEIQSMAMFLGKDFGAQAVKVKN